MYFNLTAAIHEHLRIAEKIEIVWTYIVYQMSHSEASDLGLHCLFRPVFPNIHSKYWPSHVKMCFGHPTYATAKALIRLFIRTV